MAVLEVEGGRPLEGHAVVPPDKSIAHRALILAAMGEGACLVSPMPSGRDNLSTLSALRDLGVPIDHDPSAAIARVTGIGGPSGLSPPAGPLDCGNSGTTLRLFAGILAASKLEVTLTGDASLAARPMSRLLPLESMGARITGALRGGRLYPPITVKGGPLVGVRHELPIARAQVKSALLLAGLWAKGATEVKEPARSRDHTERMLRALGVPVVEVTDGAVRVETLRAPWRTPRIEVPPDPSSAAFLLAAALVTESRGVSVDSGVNPTRTGFLDALGAMGAIVRSSALPPFGGEPVARLSIEPGNLRGIEVEGALTLRAIDEIPLLAGLAAFARGRTTIRDAGELRVKESDRLATTHAMLVAFGARSTQTEDGLIIEGGGALGPAEVDSAGDHRIALAAAVMALGIRGRSTILGAEVIDVSFPGFVETLSRLGAGVHLG